jgi:hypothetical protein
MFEDKHSYKPERVGMCDETQQNNIFTHGYLNMLFIYLYELSNTFRSVTVHAQGHIIIFQQTEYKI